MELLDEEVTAWAIEEDPHIGGRHRVTHALIQQTPAIRLAANRRVRLHSRIAITLEEL